MNKHNKLIIIVFSILLTTSCATKKDVNYLQDINDYSNTDIIKSSTTIQPDDILKITVGSRVPEAAIPYNKANKTGVTSNSLEVMKLEGYVVKKDQTIDFPVLGPIDVSHKTTTQLTTHLKNLLETNNHLKNPTVDVRLLNAKFTVLGEVGKPGTFSYTDNNITMLQALGMAGDLTITGLRNDILLIREKNGIRSVSHIDLTSAEWMQTDLYYIKPNDVIIINPNVKKVKSAGIIGDTSTFLAVTSLIISVTILLTR